MNQRKGRAVGERPYMPLQLPELCAKRRLCVLRERLPAEDEGRIVEKRPARSCDRLRHESPREIESADLHCPSL